MRLEIVHTSHGENTQQLEVAGCNRSANVKNGVAYGWQRRVALQP
jgi:hypothetical protein